MAYQAIDQQFSFFNYGYSTLLSPIQNPYQDCFYPLQYGVILPQGYFTNSNQLNFPNPLVFDVIPQGFQYGNCNLPCQIQIENNGNSLINQNIEDNQELNIKLFDPLNGINTGNVTNTFEKENLKNSLRNKKQYKQSASRNVITNIGNKMITFILSKKKTLKMINKIYPEWKLKEIKHFYDYVKNLKKELGYYLNVQKINKIWKREVVMKNSESQKLFRILSYYYLTEVFVISILSSNRIKNQSKVLHLNSRNILLNKLRKRRGEE